MKGQARSSTSSATSSPWCSSCLVSRSRYSEASRSGPLWGTVSVSIATTIAVSLALLVARYGGPASGAGHGRVRAVRRPPTLMEGGMLAAPLKQGAAVTRHPACRNTPDPQARSDAEAETPGDEPSFPPAC